MDIDEDDKVVSVALVAKDDEAALPDGVVPALPDGAVPPLPDGTVAPTPEGTVPPSDGTVPPSDEPSED